MNKYEKLPIPVTVLTFRTANKNKSSVYEIGILSIDEGRTLIEKVIRINPKTKTFSLAKENNDGVTATELKNEPTFDKIWEEIKPYIENKIIALHYAAFHENALLAVLKRYDIEKPKYKLIDIYKLAMRMNLDVDNFKFDTIAVACGVGQSKWDSLSKVRAIYSIICQFYRKKPSLFNSYVPKQVRKNTKKVTAAFKEEQPKSEITEAPTEMISPTPTTLSSPSTSDVSEKELLIGCLAIPITIIVVVAFLIHSCGYNSEFQKSIREENEQQEQIETSVAGEQPKRNLPQGRGFSDVGRQMPVYHDTDGVIVEGIHKEQAVPIYARFHGDDVAGYVGVGTEVSVKSQDLQHRDYGQYTGRLLVESVDNHQQFYIDVYNYKPTHFRE